MAAGGGTRPPFALEEIRGVSILPLAPVAAPCHRSASNGGEECIGIPLHRYLRKQSLLNILTAVCSVSGGQAPFTRAFGIDKENCKFVLPANTCSVTLLLQHGERRLLASLHKHAQKAACFVKLLEDLECLAMIKGKNNNNNKKKRRRRQLV